MPAPDAKVIINPVAGGWSGRGKWPQIMSRLHDTGLSFDYELTHRPGQALEIVQQAINSGYHYLIAVGGDGTANEVANGILGSARPDEITLGLISTGTACCFARSLGTPRDYAAACAALAGGVSQLCDVGLVSCHCQGKPIERFFLNSASIGFPAAVTAAWQHLPNRYGRTVNYIARAVTGFRCLYQEPGTHVSLAVDDKDNLMADCSMVIVNNGRYYGGDMLIAPQAHLDDGRLDMTVVGNVSKLELLEIWRSTYHGNHVRDPRVSMRTFEHLNVKSPEPRPVEVDGDIIGETPALFQVRPRGLRVVVPYQRQTATSALDLAWSYHR